MATYTLTVSTNDLGLGVLSGARVVVERRRTQISDIFSGQALTKNTAATNSSGIATILLAPDDGSVYHEIKIFDLVGVLVYSTIFAMPPQAVALTDLPVGDIISESASQAVAASVTATAQAVIATAQAVLTAADRVQTAQDVIATAADAVATEADRVQTAQDVIATAADAVATEADRIATGLDVIAALAARNLADSYAQAAASGAGIYDSVTLGRASSASTTGPTSFFQVKKGGLDTDGVTLLARQTMYQRTSGSTQNLINTVPNGTEIDSLQSVNYIRDTLPNLFTLSQLNFSTLPTIVAGTRSKITVNSEPALQINSETTNGTSRVYWRIPVSLLEGLTTFSVSLALLSLNAGSSGTFSIIQRNAGGSSVVSNVVATGLSAVVSTRTILEAASIAVDADAVYLDFDLSFNNSGGDKVRTTVVNGMLLRAGSTTGFAFPAIDVVALEAATTTAQSTANTAITNAATAQTTANTAITNAATAQTTANTTNSTVLAREGSRLFKNSWPDPAFRDTISPYIWDNNASYPIAVKNGVRCITTPTTGVAANARTLVDVSSFTSGKFSVSVVVHEKIGNQGTNNLRVRLTAHVSNVQGTPITSAWTGYPNQDLADNTFYTRLIPTTDITGATTIVVCEGFDIPATATHIGIDIRTETTVAAYISNIVLAEGSDASYRDSYNEDDISDLQAANTSVGLVYIGVNGDDTTGLGTVAAPYLTLNKAIDTVEGTGTVVLLAGSYPALNITPSKVKNIHILGDRPDIYPAGEYDYPVVRFASKVTGITKTTGRTKIYQATVAGLPTLAAFQWAYQDGVADPRTLIADADRSPQHRGRTNRLMKCAKLIKPTTTVLVDALTELDATTEPMSFIDSGILYFTVVGGGDGTLADIYLDAATGLVASGATKGSAGVLNITGLDMRYGALDLNPFKSSHLSQVTVTGARNNCVDYNVLSFETLEVSCSGSQNQYNGDGLNGHYGSIITSGTDLYAHDCWDDGFSDHEGCSSRFYGGLVEYNGGTGLAPAYGADHISYGVISRRNQQRGTWKSGAFAVIGSPLGAPADAGYDTIAWFINCIDIESLTSFADAGFPTSTAVCVDCKSIRPTTRGYNNYKIIDCGYIASGGSTSKSGATIVENTTLVT